MRRLACPMDQCPPLLFRSMRLAGEELGDLRGIEDHSAARLGGHGRGLPSPAFPARLPRAGQVIDVVLDPLVTVMPEDSGSRPRACSAFAGPNVPTSFWNFVAEARSSNEVEVCLPFTR